MASIARPTVKGVVSHDVGSGVGARSWEVESEIDSAGAGASELSLAWKRAGCERLGHRPSERDEAVAPRLVEAREEVGERL